MNISYYDFKNLPNQAQCDLVMNQGNRVNETIVHNLKYVLYTVSCFSVEIIYTIPDNRISGINVYQNKAVYAN
ncbi:hypothetical protein N6B72_13565 [Chryseobacterium soli]|uniref:hypothetical protein n=1 Tax=Chryseobacterium soli TaxID=445961 RepID=UPI0029555B8B|nr:hypothetical protein [Chryseobacterium soli]MDV7697948.1 hypothetical protein [Chryseobacterium soli]